MDQDDDDDHDDKNEIDWSKVGATLAQGDEEVIGDPDEDDRELSQSLARSFFSQFFSSVWSSQE